MKEPLYLRTVAQTAKDLAGKHFIEHLADYGITVTNVNSPKSFIEAAIKAAEGKE